jgi:XTP/dITP diphosphohydrolase
MTTLLLASRNTHKTREFAQLLGPGFPLRDLTSLTDAPEILESGKTFEENAAIKALAISRLFPGELVFADDSGLEVDALDGAPGVYSARFAGADASDGKNIEKLVRELRRSQTAATEPQSHGAGFSAARFRCVIALAKGGEILTSASGDIEGSVTAPPRGTNGFGYDPIFVPRGLNQTFAELPAELKNRISHRARAARKLAAFLRNARRSW